MIRVSLAETWVRDLRADGSLSVDWLAVLAQPVDTRKAMVTMLSIEAPPAMWDELALWCHRHKTVPVGASKAETALAKVASRVGAKIEDSLGRLSSHPGYRGRGVRAHSVSLLPAFRCKSPRARYWPTPMLAVRNAEGDSLELEAGWLVPDQRMIRGSMVTRWKFDARHPSYYDAPETPTPEQGEPS